MHTCIHTCIHTYNTYIPTYTCTHTHTHIHMHMHMHTHTCTHTHPQVATMMLADIMFRSNEFDEAIRYFAQMLQLTPNNYKALEQLILLVRRAGRLHVTSANRQCDAVCM